MIAIKMIKIFFVSILVLSLFTISLMVTKKILSDNNNSMFLSLNDFKELNSLFYNRKNNYIDIENKNN